MNARHVMIFHGSSMAEHEASAQSMAKCNYRSWSCSVGGHAKPKAVKHLPAPECEGKNACILGHTLLPDDEQAWHCGSSQLLKETLCRVLCPELNKITSRIE